ncbi:MAG TPA: CoA transferase, partial [Casimicrobium sp.]|nr:CoA transferase [Casimicrobium sp.]
ALADITLPDGEHAGETARATLLPFTMDGQRLGVRLDPPTRGAHTRELLAELGLPQEEIETLMKTRSVA